ncbi:MAG TPA: 3-isopropylmalate dehydratase small subunit [Candidatus Thermoplasmatota archaeon]|nr:3-isopropylmalate dehydratase small subunit [Candidatus Thermoplasmatota archaeon]
MPRFRAAVQTSYSGKAWVFPDNVDTDQITPGKYLTMITPEELGTHVLEGARADFPRQVAPGDILVAGRNFGCGSSREHAPLAIKGAGIPLVIAETYARIFYRNAVNVGLPALECPGISAGVKEGDTLEVDLATGAVVDTTSGKRLQAIPMSGKALEILDAGGLVPLTRRKLEARRRS